MGDGQDAGSGVVGGKEGGDRGQTDTRGQGGQRQSGEADMGQMGHVREAGHWHVGEREAGHWHVGNTRETRHVKTRLGNMGHGAERCGGRHLDWQPQAVNRGRCEPRSLSEGQLLRLDWGRGQSRGHDGGWMVVYTSLATLSWLPSLTGI